MHRVHDFLRTQSCEARSCEVAKRELAKFRSCEVAKREVAKFRSCEVAKREDRTRCAMLGFEARSRGARMRCNIAFRILAESLE